MIESDHIASFEMTDIRLKVRGKNYSFCKAFDVTLELGAFCRTADITVADVYRKLAQEIRRGDPCMVECDNVKVLTGWVTDIDAGYESKSHDITISVASKTCDIVDCSCVLGKAQLDGMSAKEIIERICAPFKIKVIWNAPDFPAPDFNLTMGDKCGEIIERICKKRHLTYTDDADGNLIITDLTQTTPAATLYNPPSSKDGAVNILSGKAHYGSRDRYSEYIVVSQVEPSDKDEDGKVAFEQQGSAIDEAVTRYRPLIIVSGDEQDSEADQASAAAIMMQRLGASNDFEYEVNGWKAATGKYRGLVWMPGSFVNVEDEFGGVESNLVIKAANLSISHESGRKSKLTLAPPQEFILGYTGKKGKKRSERWYDEDDYKKWVAEGGLKK